MPSGRVEFEKLLRESQREVLRLQRQLSVTSSQKQENHNSDPGVPDKTEETSQGDDREAKVKPPTLINTTWALTPVVRQL